MIGIDGECRYRTAIEKFGNSRFLHADLIWHGSFLLFDYRSVAIKIEQASSNWRSVSRNTSISAVSETFRLRNPDADNGGVRSAVSAERSSACAIQSARLTTAVKPVIFSAARK